MTAIALLYLAAEIRAPTFLKLRPWLLWVVVGLSGAIACSGFLRPRPRPKPVRMLQRLGTFIALASLITGLSVEAQFHWAKYRVLHADATQLARLGQHVITGYGDPATAQALIENQGVGGLFLTTRNIENRSFDAIQSEIQRFQAIRRQQGRSPLWIAADQEGGLVSRLSPPLTQLPQLSTVVAEAANSNQRQAAVTEYAQVHGQELAELGVNLNFAPVIDLNQGVINPADQYSRIYQRAISTDPTLVTQVARWYCQTLFKSGVTCTLKHFPGLGRVEADTHVASAQLDTPLDELAATDWVPFRSLMGQVPSFTMLGHATLTHLDPRNPASVSETVIADLLRTQWGYDGVLVTDDICMKAVYSRGVTSAVIQALNAGVDLILIAYDSDLYYPIMAALLQADRQGQLNLDQLARSQTRLAQSQPRESP